MLVRIYSLLFVVAIRFDDEAVIGMDISTLMSETLTEQKRERPYLALSLEWWPEPMP